MLVPESPFEHYMSKQILFFTYLMCSSVSRAKVLKKHITLRFAIFNLSEKLQNIFEIVLKKYGVIVQKSPLKKALRIFNQPLVFCIVLKAERICFTARFFLKLLKQNGEGNKENVR